MLRIFEAILWSWLNPIPWSWSRLMSSVSSSVVHPPSLSFLSFSFFFEYFSKSSLIFIWSGWWLLRMYKSCFETEQRSRFGSSSAVEVFRRMRFRRATKFFFILNIWDSSLIVLVWASFESSGIMVILVWLLHHLTWNGCRVTGWGGLLLFSSLLLRGPKVGQTSEVNSKIKIGENKQKQKPGL